MNRERGELRTVLGSMMVITALAFTMVAALITPFLPSASAANHDINASYSAGFVPSDITVAVGDTVTWHNLDSSLTHTITSDNGSWTELTLPGGGTVSRVFNVVGDYSYHCRPHPSMVGVVRVLNVIPEFPSLALVAAGIIAIFAGLVAVRRRSGT